MNNFNISDKDQLITIYGYLPDTNQYIGCSECYIPAYTGLPAYCTHIEPPAAQADSVAIFDTDANQWKLVADYRGKTMYSTSTREAITVTDIGEIGPEFTLIPPTTPHDKWDGEKWITDTAAQHAAAVAEANAKKSALLDEANAVTADWRTELELGIISDSDKAKLIAWMAYIRDVKATDTSTAPNVKFPPKPE